MSNDLKRFAGFGSDGLKGFDTAITNLQMQTYVTVHSFEYAQDKYGRPYGWGTAQRSGGDVHPVFHNPASRQRHTQGPASGELQALQKRHCEKVHPEHRGDAGISITPHSEEISVAIPVTFSRYLGTPEGTIYGCRLSGWDSLMARAPAAVEQSKMNLPFRSFCCKSFRKKDKLPCRTNIRQGSLCGRAFH